MFRMTPVMSAEDAKAYFLHGLSAQDGYYMQEIIGHWGGLGAEQLGLSGQVDQHSFSALVDNTHPIQGGRLTSHRRSNRTVGYDFSFDVPKGVSVQHALTGDTRILDAFRRAVHETMLEMERSMQARVRKGGLDHDRTTGSLVWAEFVHTTSRPVDGQPDPQLHVHAFVPNVTFDPVEEIWKAGQFRGLNRDAPYYQEAFHSRLGQYLTESGYPVKRSGGSWDLEGLPSSIAEKFSNRTKVIEAEAAKRGIEDKKRKAELGARTREAKLDGVEAGDLRSLWRQRLTEDEQAAIIGLQERADGAPGGRDSPLEPGVRLDAREAIDRAIEHSFERVSVVSDKRLLAEALKLGIGQLSVGEVKQAFAAHPDIVSRSVDDQTLVTTGQVLAEERAMIDYARDGRGTCVPLGEGYGGRSGDRFEPDAKLSREQRDAVEHVLSSQDGVVAVAGAAGAGKTTLMSEIARGIEDGGKEIHAFAPGADASRTVLREEGFERADTVARLLVDQDMQDGLKGQVLWIDEAGQLGSRTMSQLFEIAGEQDARVVLSGDTRQHASVERGDAMRTLATQAGIRAAEVQEIRRQRGKYREAVAALAREDVGAGFETLCELGAVSEIEGAEARDTQIASDYAELTGRGQDVLVVSPTHAEGERVTDRIRDELKARKRLGKDERTLARLDSTQWTEAQRADPTNYRPGDVVEFHQHAAGGCRSGRRYEVVSTEDGRVAIRGVDGTERPLPMDTAKRFNVYRKREIAVARGDRIRITKNATTVDGHKVFTGRTYATKGFDDHGNIKLDNGWLLQPDHGHIAHGYVGTSHASQGKTVDHVLIAQSATSFQAASREQFYVSVSRGRKGVAVYTDDVASLKQSIERSGRRLSASELVATPDAKDKILSHGKLVSRLERYRRLTEMNTRSERTKVRSRGVSTRGVAGRGMPSRGRGRGR